MPDKLDVPSQLLNNDSKDKPDIFESYLILPMNGIEK